MMGLIRLGTICRSARLVPILQSDHSGCIRNVQQSNKPVTYIPVRNKASAATAAAAADTTHLLQDNFDAARPFSELPGPKGHAIMNLLKLPMELKKQNGHEVTAGMFEEHGPIFRVKMGSFELVWLNSVTAVEKMLRLEGKYPRRIIIAPWRSWRDQMQHKRGVLVEDGEDWKRMRVLLDKQMMRPRHVASYTDGFNEVITDFISRIYKLRQADDSVPNVNMELFNWSLETIGTVLYETRFGGLSGTKNEEMDNFVQAVRNIFLCTEKLVYMPEWANKLFIPKWHQLHHQSWDTIFKLGEKLIGNKIQELLKKVEKDEQVSGFLSTLLASGNMTEAEVYANVTELMLAAVDTTSNTMQWMLYSLACNPRIQERLHEEVTSIVPPGTLPTSAHLQSMAYLKAFIKELLRLYPVAGVVSRVLNDDIVLNGYHIPKDTTVLGSAYCMGRDPEHFSDPEKIYPERWLRDGTSVRDKIHNFAWLPFGFGPRMCIGRRVAELEMQLLTLRVSQKFHLELGDEEPRKIVSRGLLVPNKPVNVRFIDRQ